MAIIIAEYDDLCEDMWGKCLNCGIGIYEPQGDWKFCPYCGVEAEVVLGTLEERPDETDLDTEEECGPFLEDYVDAFEMTPEQRQAIIDYWDRE